MTTRHNLSIDDLDLLNSNDYNDLGCYELNIYANDGSHICIPEASLHDILNIDPAYIKNYIYYTSYSSNYKFSDIVDKYLEACNFDNENDKIKYQNIIYQAVDNICAKKK
tara:strand:- start:1673 stop:2002 length:330 start_codon:yes stop_codon:yes gene_type:complete